MKLSKTERVQAVWNHEYSPLWWVAGDPPPKVQVGEVGRIERGGRWVRAKNQPRLRDPFTATTMAGPMMRATESTVQRSKGLSAKASALLTLVATGIPIGGKGKARWEKTEGP